jgi:hypothetical protein
MGVLSVSDPTSEYQTRQGSTSLFVDPIILSRPFGYKNKTPWPLVRERTIPTDRPPLVDEI